MQCEKDFHPPLLALKMEEGGHKPRNAGGLQKPEKARKWILPQSLQKRTCPANALILAQ